MLPEVVRTRIGLLDVVGHDANILDLRQTPLQPNLK